MKYYLYNKLSNNGAKPEFLDNIKYIEAVGLDYPKFFAELNPEDEVVLIGGDGTINFLINNVDCDNLKNNVYLKAAGTGNDFLNDIEGDPNQEILLNEYLKDLPVAYVNGMERKYINNASFGIDGYCCEEADRIKAADPNAKIDYSKIAVNGLLKNFKPRHAKITIDGETFEFDHAWLAPAMKGRFCGGGMMLAPGQDRKEKVLTVMVYHTKSKLTALMNFPKVFKGTHVNNKKIAWVKTGKEIEVEFDTPCAVQIDGETILNVKSYKARA